MDLPKSIYKYTVTDSLTCGTFTVQIPSGFDILAAGFQGRDLVIWAEVYSEAEVVNVNITLVWTGWIAPDNANYFETLIHPETGLVFHVYWS